MLTDFRGHSGSQAQTQDAIPVGRRGRYQSITSETNRRLESSLRGLRFVEPVVHDLHVVLALFVKPRAGDALVHVLHLCGRVDVELFIDAEVGPFEPRGPRMHLANVSLIELEDRRDLLGAPVPALGFGGARSWPGPAPEVL